MIAVLLVLAGSALPVALSAQGENRLWLADLELEGPFESVVLDCGTDGLAVLTGPLLAGERRTLAVPLPVRSPLGAATLPRVPAPAIEVRPPGAGRAAFLGWSEEQPDRAWETVAPALRGRPRPPVEGVHAGPRRASIAALLIVAGAFALGLTWRARLGLVAAVGVAAAVGVLWLESRQGAGGRPTTVVEGDAGTLTWLGVRGAATLSGDLGGSDRTVRLESAPAGAALEVELDLLRSTWTARGAGVALHAFALEPAGAAGAGRTFDAVWRRDAAGAWSYHGAWDGVGLPPRPGAAQEEGPDPPGWLAAGLPPGRTVLLGRLAGEADRWLRATGD